MHRLIGRAAAIALTFAIIPASAQEPSTDASRSRMDHNLADFDFVTSKLAINYAGWETKVTPETRPQLDALTRQLRARAAAASDDEMLSILRAYTSFFRDGHTGIGPINAPASAAVVVAPIYPTKPWSEHYVRAHLQASKAHDPIEGIWNLGGSRYRVGILKTAGGRGHFEAIVLSTTADGWKPGQIKAELDRQNGGAFDLAYRTGDHSEVKLTGRLVGNNVVFNAGQWGVWVREWPKAPGAGETASRLFPSDQLFLKRLSAKTLWLRVPSFNESMATPLRELVNEHRQDLQSTPNLLIDIRNNGGGSDFVYAPLVPLLYTRPVIVVGIELRASADNIALRHAVADRIKSVSPESSTAIEAQNKLMAEHLGEYVQPDPRPFDFEREDSILPFPRRVVILIDGAGSTAEQFLLLARQSHKVTLMGKSNSAGVLDFANVVSMPLPSGRFELQWSTSRSLRVPKDPVDPDGISPDIRIPSAIEDPVTYAAKWLERQAD